MTGYIVNRKLLLKFIICLAENNDTCDGYFYWNKHWWIHCTGYYILHVAWNCVIDIIENILMLILYLGFMNLIYDIVVCYFMSGHSIVYRVKVRKFYMKQFIATWKSTMYLRKIVHGRVICVHYVLITAIQICLGSVLVLQLPKEGLKISFV